MAKVKCEYCDNFMLDTEETCPHCGAVNANHQRIVSDNPKTIQELKDWYKARNLPPEETTRFFIGKDIREPKAFGIYEKNNGYFVVYKNKGDGTRAIRYEGTDEAYAVNELFLRLKEEILNQKTRNTNNGNRHSNTSSNTNYHNTKSKNIRIPNLMTLYMVFVIVSSLLNSCHIAIHIGDSSNGYYNYNGITYYRLNDTYKKYGYADSSGWYIYDSIADDWSYYCDIDDMNDMNKDFADNYEDYFIGSDENTISDSYYWNGTKFENTTWYDTYEDNQAAYEEYKESRFDNDSYSDSDYDWDSGSSWDSGGSDWDSDW